MFLLHLRLPPQIAESISEPRKLPLSFLPEQHDDLGQAAEAIPSCPHIYVPAPCSRLPEDMLGMGLPRRVYVCPSGRACVENWTPKATKVKLPLPYTDI